MRPPIQAADPGITLKDGLHVESGGDITLDCRQSFLPVGSHQVGSFHSTLGPHKTPIPYGSALEGLWQTTRMSVMGFSVTPEPLRKV